MTNTTPASRFRVERDSTGIAIRGEVVKSTMNPGYFVRRIGREQMQEWLSSGGHWTTEILLPQVALAHVYYSTEAEARYRLLLYQNPREALAAFIRGTGWEYAGTCGYCDGVKLQTPCPTCHGTGGPPSAETLMVAADWMEERGMQTEADVLRTVAQGPRA